MAKSTDRMDGEIMEIDYATGLCFGLIIGSIAVQIVNIIWFILSTKSDKEWMNLASRINNEWSDFCDEIIEECYGRGDADAE